MVVSDREKLIPGQEMGCVSEGCVVFTLRKKKTMRPEGAMQKLRGSLGISGGEQQVRRPRDESPLIIKASHLYSSYIYNMYI